MLEIKNLEFSYGKKQILKDISFKCEEGQVVGILGPNGSGKTTLIRNILGIEKLDKGNILLNDENINKLGLQEKAKKIAYVPQMLSDNFNITVMELILSGLKPHISFKIGEEELEKADELMKEFNILHLTDKNFNDLSGGQKQKVLICKAILQRTDICILDEPISFLDLGNSIEILKIIKKLAKESKKTILIIIHDLNMAKAFSDKILLMKDGKVVQFDYTDKVLTCEQIKKIYNVDVKIVENSIIPII
ncbi:MAG: ABC transporter ATP-binding protein [Clostridium sp.]|uniref:ABC transporter ATP-binding protein n=1 Tax=Clostridium sp. TaxID=1506 RepID=UPI003F3D668A